ncbi:MAG: hypothetical protein LQ348_006324 [Seirophora lacunosa]|nr:MAG: hypothetical protein LQ348_006324 [Seirophora lacunosa]
MATPSRTRLYRELLTPALHRRFTQAAGVSLTLSYITAVVIGDKSSLIWSWLPLGKAGIRTLLLFLSPLLVFVLRVAQLHCGSRSTASPFHTFRQYLQRRDTLETSFCYGLSALLFSEVYIWSVSKEANLNWVVQGRSWERQRLNERPIYLRSLYLGLALLQTAIHLWTDYDKVRGSMEHAHHTSAPHESSQAPANPVMQLKSRLAKLPQEIGIISSISAIVGPILYSLTVRKTAWRLSLVCARFFRWDIPSTAELSIIPPYHITLIIRSLISSSCLLLLWRGSNIAFSVYVAQEPVKRGQPLTHDSSDPNGSLINGLRSRKSLVKTFAFWELAKISQSFPQRRIFIFKDIDRPGGPAWSQISSECLEMIQGITTRVAEYSNPSTPQQASIDPGQLQSLPRLGIPPREEPVLLQPSAPSTRREMVESKVGSFAKSYGNNPASGNGSPVVQQSKYYLEQARTRLLSPEQQQAISPAKVQSTFNTYLTRFLRSWPGQPFRQTFARRVRSIAFGQPFSEFVTIVDAVDALTRMATASIKEDDYGKVARDIPAIVRTFVTAHRSLESLTAALQPHWTDVEFRESQREVGDVQVTLAALRQGLGELMGAFGAFAAEIGLEEQEVRVAKMIAGKKKEMIER